MAGGVCGRGGMHGRGHAWQGGACMTGDVCGGGGGHVWQERQPLQRTVRILLECILVLYINGNQYHVRVFLCKRLPLLIF